MTGARLMAGTAKFDSREVLRKQYDKFEASVGKAGGEKWKSMSNETMATFVHVKSITNEVDLTCTHKFLTKEEFETFYEKLESASSGEKEFSLDDVRYYAREVVETEIQKHAADGFGMVDYALALAGGRVVKHSEPFGVEKGSWVKMMNLGHNKVHQDAAKMLTPSFGELGF